MKKSTAILPVIACVAGISLIALSGCKKNETNYPGTATDVRFSTDVTFEDIPVPAGFTLERGKSYSFQNDVTRVGRLVYTGRSSLNNVLSFYQQQMPLHGWQEMSYVDYDASVRYYEKSGQSCILAVEPIFGLQNIRIVLSTQPLSKTN